MSHEIYYGVVEDTKEARKSYEYEMNEAARHDDWREGSSGLPSAIVWKDKLFPTKEAARNYIEEQSDRSWYLQIAVKFNEPTGVTYSKACETLAERSERLKKRYDELNWRIHYEGVSSALVSCRSCSSKIASAHIGHGKKVANRCPVCGADLRPQSTLAQIENAKAAYEKAYDELRKERKKCEAKAKQVVKWLVKTEYHT